MTEFKHITKSIDEYPDTIKLAIIQLEIAHQLKRIADNLRR